MIDGDKLKSLNAVFQSAGAALQKQADEINLLKTPYKFPNIDTRNYLYADYQYEVIKEAIKSFEADLDQDHEVAFKLASFGQSIILHIVSIGYSNPSLLHFRGFIPGNTKRSN